ncbi:anaphase-promoting complex subunit 11 [Zopfochytrium polystomum]|nr:anaphase-promoting complex subunit 11 [Zopfochytrium polystomum]
MKITIRRIDAVAAWQWKLRGDEAAPASASTAAAAAEANAGENDGRDEEDDEDDVCGICRAAFDGCCPTCAVPGDACPPVIGECTHTFHQHCIDKWVATDQSRGTCPMDRSEWRVRARFPQVALQQQPLVVVAPLGARQM